MHQPNGIEFATTRLATGSTTPSKDIEGGSHPLSPRVLRLAVLPRLRPDQRGHGDSEKPECCCTVDGFAADVGAFMEAIGISTETHSHNEWR